MLPYRSSISIALSVVFAVGGIGLATRSGLAQDPPKPAKVAATIDQLAWLAGGWRQSSADDKDSTEEHWTAPAAGTMLAVNRTIEGGATVFFEFLRIEEKDGTLVYLAQPKGRAPATPFTLAEIVTNRVIFANAAHDFPQLIEYRREGDLMHATVSGEMDGQRVQESWTWERVKPVAE